MKRIMVKNLLIVLVAGVLVLGINSVVKAQNVVMVDITKAALVWDWSQGSGGMVEEFKITCGSKVTAVGPTVRTVVLSTALPGVGQYGCSIVAHNQFGDSPSASWVSFEAGTVPVVPVNLQINVQ